MTTQAFSQTELPRFRGIEPDKIEPTLRNLLTKHKERLNSFKLGNSFKIEIL